MKLPRVPEKVEQANGVQLLRSIGARVYVIGHPSPNDGRSHRGTGQTPGIPDVLAFLTPRFQVRDGKPISAIRTQLWWEAKAKDGSESPAQQEFRLLCRDAEICHVVGDFDALIAWLIAHGYVKASSFPHYRIARTT